MKQLIDISAWQGEVDFSLLAGKVDGVMIRAGFGARSIDGMFSRNISECNRLGIPCGVYWFSYAYTPNMALLEALACLKAIENYRVELPVAFDWEYDSERYAKEHGVTPTADLCNNMAHSFLDQIEKAGYYAMLYTNPDMKRRYFDRCESYDLWLASWGVPEMPECGIWQYGLTSVDGVTGRVDGNQTKRDYPELIRSAGLNHLANGDKLSPTDKYGKVKAWAEENGIAGKALTLEDLIKVLEMMEAAK